MVFSDKDPKDYFKWFEMAYEGKIDLYYGEEDEVVVDSSIHTIGESAFAHSEVKEVVIMDGVRSIEPNAFDDCFQLETITLPSTITEIQDSTFHGCKSLKDIRIPRKVKKIGKYAFAMCESLSLVIIPEGVTKLEDFAFMGCDNLKDIVLPASLEEIGIMAIYQHRVGARCHVLEGSYAEKFCRKNKIDHSYYKLRKKK